MSQAVVLLPVFVASGLSALYLFTFGAAVTFTPPPPPPPPPPRDLMRVDPRNLIGIGLFFGMISVFPALFNGEPLLTAQWWANHVARRKPKNYSFRPHLFLMISVFISRYSAGHADAHRGSPKQRPLTGG